MNKAKRMFAIFLSALLVFSLIGCSSGTTINHSKVSGDIAYFTAMDADTLESSCKGNFVEVTGKVSSGGLSYIRIGDPLLSEVTFDCYPKDGVSVSDIAMGEEITVYGECTGILYPSVTLKNCQITRKDSADTPATGSTEVTESTEATESTVHVHSFTDATCEDPKTCTACGATEGSAMGHSWQDATCTKPKTCSVCKETSGTTAAHSYQNGKCSVCGQADPNDPSTVMVWIPTKGGKKYHSKASCSNMIDPQQVTQEYAEANNFTPCKKCH